MSDELRLPDELAACEARLAAMAPPASRIDRDELMYRAGWAAALAGGAGVGTTRLAVGNSSSLRSTVVASLASAAVAASLAVAVTLQWGPPAEPVAPIAAEIPPAPQVEVADATAPRVRPAARQRVSTDFGPRSLAPLIALRRQELSRLAEGSPVAAADAAVYVQPTPAKTARQLLEELLPESAVKPAAFGPSRLWPFRGVNPGDSI